MDHIKEIGNRQKAKRKIQSVIGIGRCEIDHLRQQTEHTKEFFAKGNQIKGNSHNGSYSKQIKPSSEKEQQMPIYSA